MSECVYGMCCASEEIPGRTTRPRCEAEGLGTVTGNQFEPVGRCGITAATQLVRTVAATHHMTTTRSHYRSINMKYLQRLFATGTVREMQGRVGGGGCWAETRPVGGAVSDKSIWLWPSVPAA